jgi:hypothetical protein
MDHAINDARDTGQAATLMFALGHAPLARASRLLVFRPKRWQFLRACMLH